MNNTFKKLTLASLIIASGLMGSMANAAEENSQILPLQVTGSINSPACVVTLSQNSLELGEPVIADLKTVDETPSTTSIHFLQVVFNECTTINAEVSVLGVADAKDGTILANASTVNAAANVGVGVWSWDDKVQYKIGGEALKTTRALSNLAFGIVKSNDTDAVTAGDISATAQIKVAFL